MEPMLATIALEPRRWDQPRSPAMTLFYLLPHIARAGFTDVEAWQWHASTLSLDELQEVRDLADSLGVKISTLGVYPRFHAEGRDEALGEMSVMLDRARVLGATRLKALFGGGKGGQMDAAAFERFDRQFARWHSACAEAGVQILAELHAGTIFDPPEVGLRWLDGHPEFDLGICYQPYDFADTEAALELAHMFAGRVRHVHLQARDEAGEFCALAQSPLDYATVLAALVARDEPPTMAIEFVRSSIQEGLCFDLDAALADARADAAWVRGVLAGLNRLLKNRSHQCRGEI